MSEPFPFEIPEHIRKCAVILEEFFTSRGVNDWALMGIRSRSVMETVEHCEDCNFPLSACGEPNVDGTPTMDCQVCKLEDLLATERAAREAVERQREVWRTECGALAIERDDLKQRAEAAEAKLSVAIGIIEGLLSDMHSKWLDTPRFKAASQYLSSSEPPALLKELSDLRALTEQQSQEIVERSKELADECARNCKDTEHPHDCGVIDDILFHLNKRGYEVTGIDGDESPAEILVGWFHAQIREAKEQHEELLRDKERLDWLNRVFTILRAESRNRFGGVVQSFEWLGTQPEEIQSLREAIDAASADAKGSKS